MNEILSALVWSSIQIALFSTLMAIAWLICRKWFNECLGELLPLTMVAILVFTLLANVPLPSWIPSGSNDSLVQTVSPELSRHSLQPRTNREVTTSSLPDSVGSSSVESDPPEWAMTINQWWRAAVLENDELESQSPTVGFAGVRSIHWLRGIAWTMFAAICLGFARLIIGFVSLNRLKRSGLEVTDPVLQRFVQQQKSEMGISLPIEVRATGDLSTAATIGWVKPIILLPDDWTQWTHTELSTAVSHELAHVAGNDFAKNIIAQLAIAFNFFNPMVHWLGRELRIAQELLADSRAATANGGHRPYLRTMAEMALRQDQKQVGWLAHPFLPTRTTFLRRIEMLKCEKKLEGSNNRAANWLLKIAVVAIALTCIGFRMPIPASAANREANTNANEIDSSASESSVTAPKTQETVTGTIFDGIADFLRSFTKEGRRSDRNMENIRNIALSMHNYSAAYGHFPGPAMKKEGSEHAYSWRIAILPYMEQQELYDNYRFDEAWDSEHNSEVTAKMPDVFRHSSQDEDSTDSSVFVFAGSGTMFDSEKTLDFGDIVDGTANTIMLIRAKRESHWAKPEDLSIEGDDASQLEEFEEQLMAYSEAIVASRADGSVFKMREFDADSLMKMIVIADEN